MPPVSLNQDLSAPIAAANLGQLLSVGTGTLATGQLVINNIDLAGTYGPNNAGANLAAAINDLVPYVEATWTATTIHIIEFPIRSEHSYIYQWNYTVNICRIGNLNGWRHWHINYRRACN